MNFLTRLFKRKLYSFEPDYVVKAKRDDKGKYGVCKY